MFWKLGQKIVYPHISSTTTPYIPAASIGDRGGHTVL
jgi:hypothetical protein